MLAVAAVGVGMVTTFVIVAAIVWLGIIVIAANISGPDDH